MRETEDVAADKENMDDEWKEQKGVEIEDWEKKWFDTFEWERQKDKKTERQKDRRFWCFDWKKWLNEKDSKTFFEKYTDYMQKVK
jgi:hypothetical protein